MFDKGKVFWVRENNVVEVVRCKDCCRGDIYSNLPAYIYCMEHFRLVGVDDFCSYGERKDNG